ncbi:MAG: hypothetical protein ACLFP4_12870, partial [Spirochaetales bacterium]
MWGLELMVELVDLRALPVTRARNVGRKMHQVNPRSITKQVLTDFLTRIAVETPTVPVSNGSSSRGR